MRAEMDECRRIARELHDGTAQTIAAVGLNLTALRADDELLAAHPRRREILSEALRLVEEAARDLRSRTFLLHPLLLESFKLSDALRHYIEGFSRRSGIVVNLEISAELLPVEEDAALAIFRIVQESLANILNHARSAHAIVRLGARDRFVELTVEDEGCGFNVRRTRLFGVGIASMKERVAQLGGKFHISSSAIGTVVHASVPASK
jgi:signal transduction histidine kinase